MTQCDTGVIHESGMYHTLHNMDINTYKTKCDNGDSLSVGFKAAYRLIRLSHIIGINKNITIFALGIPKTFLYIIHRVLDKPR